MFAEYLQNVQMPNLLPRFHFLKQIFVAQILVIYLSELQVVLYAICDGKEINDKCMTFYLVIVVVWIIICIYFNSVHLHIP